MCVCVCVCVCNFSGFPDGTSGKNLPANAGGARDVGSPGGGNDNPLWYSCLENPMDRGAWWVHKVTQSQTQLSNLACTHAIFYNQN